MAASYEPSRVDYSTRAPALVGVMGTGLVLCLIAVTLRFYTRLFVIHNLGADDWTALFSFVFLVVSYSLLGAAIAYGLGRHIEAINPPSNLTHIIKLTWLGYCFSPIAEAAGKISVALLLLRVTVAKAWKRFLWSLIVLNLVVNSAVILSLLTACRPVNRLWEPALPGNCSFEAMGVMLYVQGSAAAVSDLVLAIAPAVLLWSVRINMRSKLLLCGLLGLGALTAVSGFLRLGFSTQLYSDGMEADSTWSLAEFIIWKTVEPSLSIVVGCLPTLRPLFDSNSWTKARFKTLSSSWALPSGAGGFRVTQVLKPSRTMFQQSELTRESLNDTRRASNSQTVNGTVQV